MKLEVHYVTQGRVLGVNSNTSVSFLLLKTYLRNGELVVLIKQMNYPTLARKKINK